MGKRKREDESGAPRTKRAALDEDAILTKLKPLKAKFRTFLTMASHSRYNGGGVKLGGTKSPGSLSAGKKIEINRIGRTHGCHTCGSAPQDVWIADHIPPKELAEKAILHYWPGWKKNSYRFYPHCNGCAAKQSALVKKLNGLSKKGAAFPVLKADEQKNIHHNDLSLSISGKKAVASGDQRAQMQDFGDADGCHVCGKRVASETFDADHLPPQEFGTSFMQEALRILGLRVPEWQVRPQCKTCSRGQGTDVKKLSEKVRVIMKEHGLKVYK